MPDTWGFYDYEERGQGVEFISGSNLSTLELYYNSYPIDSFSYVEIDNINIMQTDYDEDGFGVGYIRDMDKTELIQLRMKVFAIASESDWSLDTEKQIARVMDNSKNLEKTVEALISVLSPTMTDEEALEAIKTVK